MLTTICTFQGHDVPSSQSVLLGLEIQNGLSDGGGQGLHPFVAGLPGNPLVHEGSFRSRCVGGIPAEWAGVDENFTHFLPDLAEYLVLPGVSPKTTLHQDQWAAFRQDASQDIHYAGLELLWLP